MPEKVREVPGTSKSGDKTVLQEEVVMGSAEGRLCGASESRRMSQALGVIRRPVT